jgi:hypothetical protein
MELGRIGADRIGRLPAISPAGDRLWVRARSQNRAPTRGFLTILRKLRKLADWMVARVEFKLSENVIRREEGSAHFGRSDLGNC